MDSVSDDAAIGDYEQRKRLLRERVARADADTAAIFAADKISNVRELRLLPASRLDPADACAKLTHYRASLTMLRTVHRQDALIDLLEVELHQLVARWTDQGLPS